jgi:hypothetical protein
MAGFCEYGNRLSDSIVGIFLPAESQLLKRSLHTTESLSFDSKGMKFKTGCQKEAQTGKVNA